MRFSVSSSELLHGLVSVSRVIANKPSSSILENFLFDLKGNALTVTASDGETTLKTVIGIDNVHQEGAFAVPARRLTDYLKEFPDQPLTFYGHDNTMEITWINGESKIPCFNADDYPQLPALGETHDTLEIPAETLLNGINNTIYATAEEELRPVMNGIFFDLSPESSAMVASDAHKLICFEFKDAKVAQQCSFILHKKPAAILKSILPRVEENISIIFDSKNAYFNFGTNMLVCRLIEGKYPQYRSVIPKNDNKLIIGRTDFLNSVRRIAVCSAQASNQIKLKLSLNEVVVSAQDLSFSTSAYERLSCSYEGDEMEIGFKAQFLIEILTNLPYSNVCMELADPCKAVLIVSADETDPDENLRALLMPVMINV